MWCLVCVYKIDKKLKGEVNKDKLDRFEMKKYDINKETTRRMILKE